VRFGGYDRVGDGGNNQRRVAPSKGGSWAPFVGLRAFGFLL
jgi:hypothetical protein